jgi:hypothetical protein
MASQQRQKNAVQKEGSRQRRRRAREEIGGSATRQKATAAATAADTQRATLGFLQQHDPNESGGDHQVNDKEDGGHNGVIQKLKI